MKAKPVDTVAPVKNAHAMLNAAIIELEARFNVKTGIWSAYCQTGEAYVEICSGGEKVEGASACYYPTRVDAVRAWATSMNAFADGKTGTLYWRSLPEVGEETNSGFTVYARLMISDNPIIMRIADDQYGTVERIEPISDFRPTAA